jgi:hypothetical protein
MLLLCPSRFTRLKKLPIILPLAGLSLLLPGFSRGAEWSLKGIVDQTLSYDDNVLMQVNPQGSFKYMIIPVVTFQHKTNVSEIYANALYGTQIFTDIEGLDQDIQNYGLGGLYKTERFDWGLSSSFSITPSRNTAVQNSGVFNNNSDSTTWSVSPSVGYKIDAVNSLILSSSYSETTFSSSNSTPSNPSVVNSGFSNNNTINVNLGWERLWTDRYKSAVSLFYNNFESQQPPPNNGNSVAPSSFDTVGINFSNDYAWSKNLNLMATVGGRHTESSNSAGGSGSSGNNSSIGFLADVGANYTGKQFSAGLHFNRSLTPSNLGQLQEQTGVDLNFNYRILENLSASFTASYQESSFVNSSASVNSTDSSTSTRKNIVFQPSINWQMAPEWSLGGSYRYRFQDGLVDTTTTTNTEVINGQADSNLFMVFVNYNWQGLKISR